MLKDRIARTSTIHRQIRLLLCSCPDLSSSELDLTFFCAVFIANPEHDLPRASTPVPDIFFEGWAVSNSFQNITWFHPDCHSSDLQCRLRAFQAARIKSLYCHNDSPNVFLNYTVSYGNCTGLFMGPKTLTVLTISVISLTNLSLSPADTKSNLQRSFSMPKGSRVISSSLWRCTAR